MINLGSILPVGTIIHSMLTTTQFQSEYGENWVLVDGRSVTGSKYEQVTGSSTIPDARGTFLRCKDNGVGRNADGELPLGTYTDDKFESHSHSIGQTLSAIPASGGNGFAGGDYAVQTGMGSTGSNETAPKSIIVNMYIRIN